MYIGFICMSSVFVLVCLCEFWYSYIYCIQKCENGKMVMYTHGVGWRVHDESWELEDLEPEIILKGKPDRYKL